MGGEKMGVNSIKEKIVMKLKFSEKDLEAGEKFVSKSYTGLKAGAEDEKIYDTALIIAGLQKKDLETVAKLETTILTRI